MPALVRRRPLYAIALCASFAGGCGPEEEEESTEAIAVGVLLPFTGDEAALGRNLEQAVLLAVADVNAAGGVGGQKLTLVTRDSNSGSPRGFNQALQLLYGDEVKYLIGPDETDLANLIVPDIKALDLLDILPGYAAPSIEFTGGRGAWVRLAPSTTAFACAMGQQVVNDGASTVNALSTSDDYNSSLTSDFISLVGSLGGEPLPTVTAPVGQPSYAAEVRRVMSYGSDLTLLAMPPESASIAVTEWTIAGSPGSFYLSPLLRTDVFLTNVPFDALNGALGLSPSSSLASECTPTDTEELDCTQANADAFSAHFADYWQGEQPFAEANYYYDAVVLLALGLSKGLSDTGELPDLKQLHADIRSLGEPEAEPVRWDDLRGALTEVRLGAPVRYVGAAAEYRFDRYGAAQHTVFDHWEVSSDDFVETGTFEAICPATL
jgi:ABC-type branched-subunit amino acid transport system substrate-binding protein